MNTSKKILACLSVMLVMVMMFAMTAYAASESSNLTFSSTKTELEPGDTFMVTVAQNEMTVSSFVFGLRFDTEKLEVTRILWGKLSFYDADWDMTDEKSASVSATAADANNSGSAGATFVGSGDVKYFSNAAIMKIQFKVKEGVSGTTDITLFEKSDGADGFIGDADVITLTIGSSEPVCEHSSTEVVANLDGSGTHNVVCADPYCREVVTANVPCSGGKATCMSAAICEECGWHYGEADKNNHIGTPTTVEYILRGANCEDTGLKQVIVYCSGEDGCGSTISDEKVDIPATGHGKTNGFRYPSNDNGTHNVVCLDCNKTTEENVNCDYTTGSSAYTCVCDDVKQFKVYWYDLNGLLGTSLVDYGAPLPTCPYTPTIPEGYSGVGWCDPYGGDDAPATMPAYDLDLEYFVKPNLYTVTFLYENGETWKVNTNYHGDVIKNLAKDHPYPETKVGHTFIGWGVKDEATGKIELVTTMTATGDLTLYPVFEVNTYTLTVFDMPAFCGIADPKVFTVPYGTNILEYINGKVDLNNAEVNTDLMKGYYFWQGNWMDYTNWSVVDEDSIVYGDMEINVSAYYRGWLRNSTDDPWSYMDMGAFITGWHEIDGEWYYFFWNPELAWNYVATGLARVPYPTEKINGITYAPDAETLEYCANKGKTFIDATEAWFYFDEDGKFLYNDNHYISHGDSFGLLVNGMLAWHPGLIKIAAGEYAYFIGDEVNGGNIPANGDTYIIRNNGIAGFAYGDVYNFTNGRPTGLDGIVDGKYYENSKLMMGAGLVKLDAGYVYVRSNGQVATGMYWVTKTNGLVNAALYNFGTDGILQSVKDPSVNGLVDGVYYKNGMPYYAGLIVIEGETYYVKSNGEVATGDYYITKVDNYTGNLNVKNGDKLTFNDEGKLQPMKDGIVDVDGVLYYYVNNHVQYGAGLVELGDGSIIYVRTNGQLAIGEYWATNHNDVLPEGMYFFDENGKLVTE